MDRMLQVGIEPYRRQNACVLVNERKQKKKTGKEPSLGIEGGQGQNDVALIK